MVIDPLWNMFAQFGHPSPDDSGFTSESGVTCSYSAGLKWPTLEER